MTSIKVEINKIGKIRLSESKTTLKNQAKKIIDILLQMPQIQENSPIFKHDFSTLTFELTFCNDPTIKEINATYRNKDKTTDVITFALFADDENSIVINKTIELGEIIISVDTLVKQAQENNNDIKTELYTLITHGILHLLGFDHQTQKDYDFVVGIQEAVIKNL